jgi:30S ribosomal protein S31
MGKGDKKTRRGKIANGSYGKFRAHKVKKNTQATTTTTETKNA